MLVPVMYNLAVLTSHKTSHVHVYYASMKLIRTVMIMNIATVYSENQLKLTDVSRNSSISIPAGYWLDGRVSIPRRGKIFSSS
jgi:hypothetical protein